MTTRARPRRGDPALGTIAVVALGLYVLFILVPVIMSAWKSLTDENPLLAQSRFVGIANYTEMTHDSALAASLTFTLILAAAVTLVANAAGIGFATLLNKTSLSFRVMRTVAFLPQVLSGVIVAFVWRYLLAQDGILNHVLLSLGIIGQPVTWLGTPHLAMFSVGLVAAWVLTGFTTVVHLAALQSIPVELYQAAMVDGAGRWKRFRHITFPMLAPGTTISVTISLITMLKLYDIIAVLTSGGPADSTQSTALYIIQLAFTDDRYGYASAVAMLLLVVSAGIALTVTSLLRRREVEL
ncbi:carbohydrate ABC transporter permease [Streptacidiphilus jiangxiensis]|uniref:Multiple sugar transport system permease protein/raffinose/stachyose/melibiose transport system permease protein n=1 Tax=Streptacidiphilus jiangxiensis TaxID=235985 RepID=A0A1H7WEJ7_STRJI|nr:sugar ABC transporter permease [Streptacidiphilus jiangxiensis]SEM19458.1 multiple sugar transport system permease protein/raffinose/stachyose/melibiose transport system permease protein [Streptacidiphilus jiangxiensis]